MSNKKNHINFGKKFFFLLFFHFIFFNSFISARENYKYNLAVCAIFQNEASYLREWIEFHKLVGVKKFYLFNNLSNDNYKEVLEPYIKSHVVTLIEWPFKADEVTNWNAIQCNAYEHAIKLTRKRAKWVAFLDTDEFLFPVKTNSLSKFLKKYRRFGGVAVNWQMYGTSGVKKILENELMIEKLTLKAPAEHGENIHVKVIVRPKCVVKFGNPHQPTFRPPYYMVDADKVPTAGPFSHKILIDKIRINHYWSRDEDFFNKHKLPRRLNWNDGGCHQRLENINKEEDLAIFKFIPRLKKSIKRADLRNKRMHQRKSRPSRSTIL